MSRTFRLPGRTTGRWRPRFECLETRLPLSAFGSSDLADGPDSQTASSFDSSDSQNGDPTFSVVGVSPAQGASTTISPTAVFVTFDRPIDPFSVGSGDVLLEQPDSHGNWTSIYDSNHFPTESLDDTGTRLTLTLPQALPAGTYRVVLSAETVLSGLDFSVAPNAGADQTLGSFTVAKPGMTLANAANLGSPASHDLSVRDQLDFQTTPDAVKLYKFTLPTGHHWRVGAEVVTPGSGNGLHPAVSLFDAQGHVITTATLGQADSPNDPYFFEGLDAGTYYLGVSGQDNLPGTANGYDPAAGKNGSIVDSQNGGAFQLDLIADPADQAVRLTSATLNHADPLDPTPTGLTLAFSGLLNPQTIKGDPSSGIVLVDANGRLAPMTLTLVNEWAGQYTFLFDSKLAPGRYTVAVPDRTAGGATDLAGFTPVAPGQRAGVLDTFDVKDTRLISKSPNDLGPLDHDVHQGITTEAVISPKSSTTYRFVVEVEGQYNIQTESQGGSVSVFLLGQHAGPITTGSTYLYPGVYYIQFTNTGATSLALTWTISSRSSWDSVLYSGVGQGPALNLRWINPSGSATTSIASNLQDGPGAPGFQSGPFATIVATTSANPAHDAPSTNSSVSNVSPTTLPLTIASTLVGRPSTQTEHVAAVATNSPSGTLAMAFAGPGLFQGLSASRGQNRFGDGGGETEGSASLDALDESSQPINGAMVVDAIRTDPRPDEVVLESAGLFAQAGTFLSHLLTSQVVDSVHPVIPDQGGKPEKIRLARDDSPGSPRLDRVEQANFATPIAIGVASLMALRCHQPFHRWMKKTRQQGAATHAAEWAGSRGPHIPF